MERTLSLVLDENCKLSLTLMKKGANEIDDFTTKNFENSEQIREHFKDKIAEFLMENKGYIEAVSEKMGRKFRGRIVVLEVQELDGSISFVEKRVLYKKHLVAFNEMIKDRATMLKFLQLEKVRCNQNGLKKLISEYLSYEIRTANYKAKSRVKLIRKEIKRNSTNFYDILRIIIKAYEIERKKRKLPTIESIYNMSKVVPNESFIPSRKKQEFYLIDGFFYPIDDIPFDLEQLSRLETNYHPDGLGPYERFK